MSETSTATTSDAEAYLLEIVGPTIRDLEENPTSRRHAFIASVVVFHTIDYIFGNAKAKNQRDIFRKESQPFATVESVAHAFKHVQTGKVDEPKSQPLNVNGVISRPSGAIGDFAIGYSRIGDEEGGVTLNEDVSIDLLNALKQTVAFLKTKTR